MRNKPIQADQLIPTSSTPPPEAGFYRVDRNTIGVVGELVQMNPATKSRTNVTSGAMLSDTTVAASRDLAIDDSGKFLVCDSGSAIALTVQADATTGWAGTVTVVACRKGVGAVTFAAGAGVTLRGDLATPAQYCSKGIVRIGTNEWTLDYCNQTISGSTIAGAIATAMNTDALFRILLIGDSTADATTEWAYLLLQQLQSRYPNAQVQYSLWDNVNKRWPATTILQQGSGSGGVIILNNCSIAGSQPDWIIGSDFFKICKVGAELLILNHGHNISNSDYPDAQKIITQYEENVESALAIVGPCHVMIIAQNPQMGLSNQTKATAARKYATECGFVSADVDLAFVAAGNGASLHTPDQVHPSVPEGHTLIKNVVLDAIDNKPSYIVTPSLVNTYTANMLYNGNFAAGSANAVPTGWSGNNIGVTDSITLGVNCETLPRALSLLAASGSGQAWIRQELAIEDFQACVGRIVTLAVRMWRPVGAPNTCGKIQLYASGTGTPSHVSASSDYGRGAWSWRFVSVTVPANATVLRAFIYADTSATPTTNAAYAILVDRAILVIGRRPRDAS